MTLASQNTGGKERRTPADRSVGIRRLYGTAGPGHGLRQPTLADPRAGDEMLSVGGREGEAFGLALAHIEDELRMLPDLVLAAVDIERAATHLAQEHPPPPPGAPPRPGGGPPPAPNTGGGPPHPAASRLEEHDRAPLGHQVGDRL